MRLSVEKTLKMYVGGRFIRSESGRVLPLQSPNETPMYACHASRKDLRDSIAKSRAAQAGWAGRTAYNRGQILYRLAEMMDDKGPTLPTTEADWTGAVDRAVHHAGWSDKITAILSSLNPVGQAFVNYSMIRPMGVVVGIPHPDDGLLGLVELTCQALLMGDTITLLTPISMAELVAAYAELLHTSDIPAGTVNLLTGPIDELIAVANIHDDLDCILAVEGAVTTEQWTSAEHEGAHVLRRLVVATRAKTPAGPDALARLGEIKTVWMSAGGEVPGGRLAY
ncbi:MAG: aldehyde dehydrogenase family protein [Myxococcota bacterium]